MQDSVAFDKLCSMMRSFFHSRGFIEVPSQARLSILAACEDPRTISQFIFGGLNYPLPQTGQMWLEADLLQNPTFPGVFCVSTSYRNEPFPVPGRHDLVFPMFEFESHGDMDDLRSLEASLLAHMGFPAATDIDYDTACRILGKVDPQGQLAVLDGHDEGKLYDKLGPVISLEKFPLRTDPFWNMRHLGDGLYAKIDVLLYGMETIGSAERSSNVEEMREQFHTISDGQYAGLLFNAFGRHRVETELDNYLAHKMIPRFGGGIGITRMARAMQILKGDDPTKW
jgi:aspartyl/asparaginyl-tRNA synthetase